jgi:hypothetical protein
MDASFRGTYVSLITEDGFGELGPRVDSGIAVVPAQFWFLEPTMRFCFDNLKASICPGLPALLITFLHISIPCSRSDCPNGTG